jgi:hypothetical protein
MKKVIGILLGFGVTLPIWYYLLYQILVRLNATELMWFLYWIYIPVGIVLQVLGKLVEWEGR